MISSVDGRSSAEVWADFFQRFGKNCNTISRTETEGKKDLVILPDGIELKKVIQDLGKSRGERYLLLINHLFFRGIYRRKSAREEGNFLPVHRDTLVELGGNRYKALLDYGIKTTGHLIKSPKRYIVDARCHEYRLNKEKLNLRGAVGHTLETKAAIKIWHNRTKRSRKKFVAGSAARQKIAESSDGLRFNYEKAFSYVDTIHDSVKKSHRLDILLHLLSGGELWSVDRQGRNYTILVVVPRDLRRYFSFRGEPLVVVDIKSCHPLLHSLLYPENEPEKTKYLQVVEQDFWGFMNSAAGNPYDLSEPEQKDLLKESLWSEVFYGWREEKPNAGAKFARAFEREFPVLWENLQDVKNGKRGVLPRAMQATEADVVLAAVEKVAALPHPVITVHDAIVTTQPNAEAVRRAIRDVFNQVGLKPVLVTTPLTLTG